MKQTHQKKNKVLVVDHDPQTYKILDIVLNKQDFEVIECLTGAEGIRLCVSLSPDIILIDFDMPDMKGKEIIKAIREWSQTPVIIVSSRKADDDVVHGLNYGADDYVIKPFNADVLRARINASLRKSAVHEVGAPELSNGPLRINLVRHEVFLSEKLVSFTPKEYHLLRYFIINSGKMLGHREILNEVWGAGHSDDTQYLRVFIGQIREKIEVDPSNPVIIKTELGIGYRMELFHDDPVTEQRELAV
jgi:two-component system KDP operon response regulator KdpE